MNKVRSSLLVIAIPGCLLIGWNNAPALGAAPLSVDAPPEVAATADVLLGGQRSWKENGRESFEMRRNVIPITAPDASIFMDAASGLVVFYARTTPLTNASPGARQVSQEAAQAAAEAFAQRAGAPLQEWTLDRAKYLDHGTAGQEYEFNWKKYYFGVRMPARLDVNVDAWTGGVIEYFLIDDPLTIPIQPRVSAEQAVAAVAKKMGYVQPVVGRVQLSVWYTSKTPGPERLYWSMEDMRDSSVPAESWNHVISADVDAVTGQIVTIFVPMVVRHPNRISPAPSHKSKGKHPLARPARILHLQVPLPMPANAPPPATTFEVAERARALRAQAVHTVIPAAPARH